LNNKTKYILLILIISTFVLLIYNHNNILTEDSFDPIELKFAKIFFGIGILFIGLYVFNKNWRKLLIKFMFGVFGVCLVLNLNLFIQSYKYVQLNKIYTEYTKLETCEEMENRFYIDLRNREIKYFQFGIAHNYDVEKILKEKYNIYTFGMGCMVRSEMECYNELVDKHLKENHNKSISDIYKESNFLN